MELSIPLLPLVDPSQLPDDNVPFEFEEVSGEARDLEMGLPAFYLHTSGSSDHPKLIAQVR